MITGETDFSSTWTTALGTTSAAVRNTGSATPWTSHGGWGWDVVAATGLGFPAGVTNALKVTAELYRSNGTTFNDGYALVQKTGLTVPAVGQSRFYRWYKRYDGPDVPPQIDIGSHPIQDGNAASDANWMFNIYHQGSQASTWCFAWWPGNGTQGDVFGNADYNRFKLNADLDKHVPYLFQLQVHRISETHFNLHARVHTSSGSLLYSDANFVCNDGSGTTTLADNPALGFTTVANMQGLNCGNNGGLADYRDDYPHLYGYQAHVATSMTTWVGAV